MPSTPVWGLPYPCAGDNLDPSIFCEFSDAVDAALVTLNDQADFVANRPNARIDRTASGNTFAAGVASMVQFDTEVFDNRGMANLSVDNTALTVSFSGIYWASFSVGGFSTFTTWTRYLMNIVQNGNSRIYRKFIVNTAQSTPTDNTITGALQCQAGDIIRGNFTFIGTGGPMVMTRANLSLSFICDL